MDIVQREDPQKQVGDRVFPHGQKPGQIRDGPYPPGRPVGEDGKAAQMRVVGRPDGEEPFVSRKRESVFAELAHIRAGDEMPVCEQGDLHGQHEQEMRLGQPRLEQEKARRACERQNPGAPKQRKRRRFPRREAGDAGGVELRPVKGGPLPPELPAKHRRFRDPGDRIPAFPPFFGISGAPVGLLQKQTAQLALPGRSRTAVQTLEQREASEKSQVVGVGMVA